MDRPYTIMLTVFLVASLALVVLFLWEWASGKLRPRDAAGRGFEPIFPKHPPHESGDASRNASGSR